MGTATKDPAVMTDEGHLSLSDWAESLRSITPSFMDVPDSGMADLARASCTALRAGVTTDQVVAQVKGKGFTEQDASLFVFGAEAAYCVELLDTGGH